MIQHEEMVAFGERLHNVRSLCGITQDTMALAMGIDRSTLSYYESGRLFPSMTKLCRLASIMCLPLDALLGGVSQPVCLFDDAESPNDKAPIVSDNALLPDNITALNHDEQLLLLYFRLLGEEQRDDVLQSISETVESIQLAEVDDEDIVLIEDEE